MTLSSKAAIAFAGVASLSMMSFRTHSNVQEFTKGQLVEKSRQIKSGTSNSGGETVANVVAAVAEAADEAALAVYEATPSVAEYALVAAAVAAEEQDRDHVGTAADQKFERELIDLKAHQLDAIQR